MYRAMISAGLINEWRVKGIYRKPVLDFCKSNILIISDYVRSMMRNSLAHSDIVIREVQDRMSTQHVVDAIQVFPDMSVLNIWSGVSIHPAPR